MAKKAIRPFDPKRPSGEDVKFLAGHGSTITSNDMERAYLLDERRDKARIEVIGQLNRQTLRDLGACFVVKKT